jgi:hypothetical protein
MKTVEIISLLKDREENYSNISVFSKFPGIYAIFFAGELFILGKLNLVRKRETQKLIFHREKQVVLLLENL